jgi:TolB-like protein
MTPALAIVALALLVGTKAVEAQCPDGSPPPCARPQSSAARAVPPIAGRARHLMFLPFRNVTRRPEHEWLVAGAPLMLEQALGQFRDLSVVPDERLTAARRRLRMHADSVPDAAQLRQLAAETGGWTAVTGNIFATGTGVRVVLQATDVPTGNVIVRASQDAPANADLREAFDALSVRLLEPAGVPAGGLGLAALTTRSVDAYRAYLRGIEHYHRSAYQRAIAELSEAVRLDSTFALAWANMALISVNARGFQETLNPTNLMYRAMERAVRHSSQLPANQVALVRVLQAFTRAQLPEARRIADSLVTADPQNVSALELLAGMHAMSVFVSQSLSRAVAAADINRVEPIIRQLLSMDPNRRMAYSLPTMVNGMAAGLFWGHTWADDRAYTSLPFMLMAASSQARATWAPLLRDSIVLVPADSFHALPPDEQARLRRPGADRARQWVNEWLAVGPEDADAHLWASRIAELQGDHGRALREFLIADSLGIEAGLESGPGRHVSLLLLTHDYARAGALADSLLAAGALTQPPFLASLDRRWNYGTAALLLSKRWESAGKMADIINGRRRLTPACESLLHEMVLVDSPVAERVRRDVMDSVTANLAAVRAVPALVPCATLLSTRLVK